MSCSPETLIGGAILFSLLVVAIGTVCIFQGSDGNAPKSKGNFLERASTPAFSDVYHLKKVQREGQDLTFLVKMGEKGNQNSNKSHPTKTTKIISGPE